MDAIIIYNGKRHFVKDCHDVFFLRDNIKTKSKVERLLSNANEIMTDEVVIKEIYKFENNQWYFYEHDFSCWESAMDYKPCPELDPEIQAEYMKKL